MSNNNKIPLVFPHVCVVEASAGSGKTYALARRYVQLLINPALEPVEMPIKNILAITFTNKATAQMKERIILLLKKIALDGFSSPAEKEQVVLALGVDFITAQQKALSIIDELVLNYNFFQVQTIHSFVNAILSTCALKLGLSSVFKIRTDAAAYLAYSLDSLVDASAKDKNIRDALYCFLRQYLYMDNKTGWFPKGNIFETVKRLFDKMNQYGGIFVPSGIDAGLVSMGKKQILSKMEQLRDNWPSGAHKSFEKSFDNFLAEHESSFDYAHLSAFFAREEFPLTKTGKISSLAQDLWSQIRSELAVVAEAESALLIDPYLDIFKRVMDNFKLLSEKDDVLFLSELNNKARLLFDEKGVTVPELYYRLAMRLKHILIDEFQDTSPLEWENIYPMVQEALSTGGSLYYVGDKKQAIYRFKGGDATLFDSVKDSFRGIDIETESLGLNYRSRGEIVSFSNAIFSQENLRNFLAKCMESKSSAVELTQADEEDVLKVFKGAKQDFVKGREAGFVRLKVLDSENKEDRNAKVKSELLGLVRELCCRYKYRDIALIVRKNDDAELLTEWLVEEGVPVESEKSLNIRNNAFIKELVSLLKFLNSPIDDLSFASFVCGDIFLSASGLKKDDIHDFIFSLKDNRLKDRSVYLYREFRRRYPAIWEDFFERFFKNVGFVPLYELTVSILHGYNCPGSFPQAQGFFMRFLELIKEKEEEKNSLSLFLEFFDAASGEDLYCRVSGVDAVKVLTIHKAKGLEFDVVVLPFLEMDIDVEQESVRFEKGKTVMRRLHKKYRKFSPRLDDIYRQEYLKCFIDELNAVYVALTRAKEELYVFLPQGARRNSHIGYLFDCVLQSENGVLPEGTKNNIVLGQGACSLVLPPSSYVDWVDFIKRSLEGEFSEKQLIQNKKNLIYGEAVHYFLSFIGDLSLNGRDILLKDASSRVENRFPGVLSAQYCSEIFERFSTDSIFAPFFMLTGAQYCNEMEIVDASGNIKRIDRIIVSESQVSVLDYKTSFEKSARDREQVLEYAALVQKIYPEKIISGFLLYLDDFSLEKVI